MAIVKGGILGTVTQKIGNIVFQKWKELNTARELVIPANPRTPKQVFQRDRFAFVSVIAQMVRLTIIIPFWKYLQTGTKTYWNVFSGANVILQPGFVDPLTVFLADYSKLLITKGSLEIITPQSPPTYNPITGEVEANWTTDIFGNGLPTDIVKVVIIDQANGVAIISPLDTVVRNLQSVVFSIGIGRTALDLSLYIFAHRGEGDLLEVSNSQFSTLVAV